VRRSQERLTPTSESLRLVDEIAQDITPDDPELKNWFQTYVSQHRLRLAYDVDIIKQRIYRDRSLLEVGAVPLLLTGVLKKLGYDIRGVDISPERFAKAIQKLDITVYQADIETQPAPIPDESIECVVFNEIFEHLRINLIFTMREIFRIVRPGGVLLLSTPNLRSFGNLKNLLLKNSVFSIYGPYEKLERLGHMGHVRLYTSKEVSQFLQRIGFSIEEVIYRGAYSPSKTKRILWRLIPDLKPMYSIVAKKPERETRNSGGAASFSPL
jgi:SAM-dependent methyltransferase